MNEFVDRVYGREETAERLNICERTLRRLVLAGAIKSIRVSERRVGFLTSEIARFLRERSGVA